MCTRSHFSLLQHKSSSFKFTYFFLIFLKFGKGNIKVFIHMFVPEELDSPLIHFPRMGKVTMLFFKAGILNPVLHIRVHENKWVEWRKNQAEQRGLKNKYPNPNPEPQHHPLWLRGYRRPTNLWLPGGQGLVSLPFSSASSVF